MALRHFFVFLFAIFTCTFSATGQSSGFLEHTVRDKETPASIAHDFYLNTKDFLLINNFPDDIKLKPGQVVLIRPLEPGEKVTKEKPYTPKATQQAQNDEPAPAKKTTYTKPKPETRTETASTSTTDKPASTTPASGNLYEKSTGDTHIVQKGQTFYRIAKTYGLTVDQLQKLNNMSDYTIKVGQELKIR